jgi:REP element-mobilizing transposase RayT
MHPNASGELILSAWQSLPKAFPLVSLDAFVLMPNHFHALVTLAAEDVETNPSMSAVVQWFKTVTTKRYTQGGASTWMATVRPALVAGQLP